jgi:hypothetical protein
LPEELDVPPPTYQALNEDPEFFPKLLEATTRWILPVAEPGAIGLLEQEDALLSLIHVERYHHVPIATKLAEGEPPETADDDVTFFQRRPKLSYLTRILHNLIVGPGLAVRRWLETLRSLGPVREIPPRDYRPPKSPDPTRWASGLGAWDRLATADSEFVSTVSHWLGDEERLNSGYVLLRKRFKEVDLSHPLALQLLSGRAFDESEAGARLDLSNIPTQSRVVIVPTNGSIEHSASDVGIGISQVVPVIVTALDGKGRTVAMEQPEIHLHPALQASLADVLIQAALGDQGNQFLIETHSEHIILRVMRRMRETAKNQNRARPPIRPEDVGVLYVMRDASRSVVLELRLDEEGTLLDPWPGGFFEEGFRERFSDWKAP